MPVLAGLHGLEPRSRPDTTPLIGVMLVLLIIQMVITPAFVECFYYPPRAASASVRPDEMPTLGIDELGRFFVGDHPVTAPMLPGAIRAELARWGADELLLKADQDVDYTRVETALRSVQAAGVRRVRFDAELPRPRARVTLPRGAMP